MADKMSGRAKPSGIAGDIARKIAGKRDPEQEQEAANWIGEVTGTPLQGEYTDAIKDGVALCNVINKIHSGSIKKIHTKGQAFVLMQNIDAFVKACVSYGVPEEDMFMTVDLWEKRNIHAVTKAVFALARTAHSKGWTGPALGPRLSTENKREFTEEQLKQGETHIGLQAGFNKGASQKGMNLGNSRHIVD